MANKKKLSDKEMEKAEGGRTEGPPQMVLVPCGVAYPANYVCKGREDYAKYCTGCPLKGTSEYVPGT